MINNNWAEEDVVGIAKVKIRPVYAGRPEKLLAATILHGD